MVRIEERFGDSLEGYIDLTKEICRGKNLILSKSPFSIGLLDEDQELVIHISPVLRIVEFYDESYFELAHELALTYERIIKEEFILEKRYQT